MKELTLSKGLTAIVDDEDYLLVSQWKWRALIRPGRTGAYAVRRDHRTHKTILLHRLLIGALAGLVVDHINGNGLDNRRENLRLCSQGENRANSAAVRGSATGLKGVRKCREKYAASIHRHGKNFHLGVYGTPEAAARAHDYVARLASGTFALTNFEAGPPPEMIAALSRAINAVVRGK